MTQSLIYSSRLRSPLQPVSDLFSTTPESVLNAPLCRANVFRCITSLCEGAETLCWRQALSRLIYLVTVFLNGQLLEKSRNRDLNIYHFLEKGGKRKRLCMQNVCWVPEDNKWYIKSGLMWFYWSRNSGNKSSANVDNKILHWPPSATRERLNVIPHNNHVVFITDIFNIKIYHFFPHRKVFDPYT